MSSFIFRFKLQIPASLGMIFGFLYLVFSLDHVHLEIDIECQNLTKFTDTLGYDENLVNGLVEKFSLTLFTSVRRKRGSDGRNWSNERDHDSQPVCEDLKLDLYPTKLFSVRDGVSKTIVNTQRYKQPVRVEICKPNVAGRQCSRIHAAEPSQTTKCRQTSIAVPLFYVKNGTSIAREHFWICMGCQCFVLDKRKSPF